MELKTLKDMKPKRKTSYPKCWWVREDCLKAEAIKWVKWYHRHKRMPIRDFAQWLDFFNITEEDLK